MLDKYIAKWTADRGIKKYTVGKKDVSCKLFLDFIVFDEHDCTATASVCWDGAKPADPKEASTEAPRVDRAAAKRNAGEVPAAKASPAAAPLRLQLRPSQLRSRPVRSGRPSPCSPPSLLPCLQRRRLSWPRQLRQPLPHHPRRAQRRRPRRLRLLLLAPLAAAPAPAAAAPAPAAPAAKAD